MTARLRRAVFLDRDGVINRSLVRDGKPYAPERLQDFEILPGVAEALQQLRNAGYLNIVITNQPDVGAGKVDPGVVTAMHDELLKNLPLDAVKACCHVEADNCECRKPKPGMILEATAELGIDLSQSFVIGDRWRDVAAGQRAGCRSLFIDYGYREKLPDKPYLAVNSLAEAVAIILQSKTPRGGRFK